MGPEDRPEDESRAADPEFEVPESEPALGESEVPEPAQEPVEPEPEPEAEPVEPEAEPVLTEPIGAIFEPEPEPEPVVYEPAEPRPPRHRVLKALGVLAGLLFIALLLVSWHKVATSDSFCSSCHEVEAATQAAQRSVHQDVPCLSCHTGPGLAGSLRYLPTLAREAVTEFTPWNVSHDVLAARSCESCHDNIATTPALAEAHTTGAACSTCHGDAAHPPFRLVGFQQPAQSAEGDVHPRLYVQTHGEDAVSQPDSCTECHDTRFCEACHFRETYPHPDDWINKHGPTQEDLGIQACNGCHPPTFCAGCHGTEIPHNTRWLGEHWRDLEDAPVTPCLLCHPKTDCTTCHSEHGVHREQDLFVGGTS
ncbi:MAG: NapC/NirT family cytochrome c [Solirubrobacterales bacterium]